MRKIFLVIVAIMAVSFTNVCKAQNIERLSTREIEECATPRSVAYNFVMSIINQDYERMKTLMTWQFMLQEIDLKQEGLSWAKLYSSSEYVHDIVEMRPVVQAGYSVVITNSYVLDTDNYFTVYGEKNPYSGLDAFSVSFNCADAQDNIYDGKYGDYDTTARILLVKQDGKWKVFGFK
jgi:hypothetical protein